MKRVDIKKYPLSDTTLASLEPEEALLHKDLKDNTLLI